VIAAIRKRIDQEGGFTLIELLVVVIIIGILAAIAIPAFLGQRESAHRSAVESDLRNVAIDLETYYTAEGEYPDDDELDEESPAIGTGEDAIEVNLSDGVTIEYEQEEGGAAFTLTGSHRSVDGEEIDYDPAAGGLQEWDDDE